MEFEFCFYYSWKDNIKTYMCKKVSEDEKEHLNQMLYGLKPKGKKILSI